MPLPLAHGLVGATLPCAIAPRVDTTRAWWVAALGACFAIAPDVDFGFDVVGIPGGHRGFTHSLTFSLAVGFVLLLWLGWARRREAVAYAAAVASHGLLDWATTRRGAGVELLWPLTDAYMRLGVVSFSEYPIGFAAREVAFWLALEFAVFVPLLLAVVWWRGRAPFPEGAT
jgi:membrane-bound metal-dependent hydrolase YbcI (DUF457 family)